MFSVLHKIIRAILIVTPIVTLAWLTVKEIVPSGRMEAVYDMRRETPFISKLYPKDRVGEAVRGADGDYYRIFLDEPVYFDLKPNDVFEKVTVIVKYKNFGQMPLKIGGLVNEKEWLFDWRSGIEVSLLTMVRSETSIPGWQTQTEVFEFKKLVPKGQKYRFGFSAPGLLPGQVEISEIKVVFERKPFSKKEVVNKILDTMVWRINKIF